MAPTYTVDQTVYIKSKDNTFVPASVLSIPQQKLSIYIIQMPEIRIFSCNPPFSPANEMSIQDTTLPSWIKNNVPATLYISQMPEARRGLLKKLLIM